jgi:tetratricopeptide (TPR) repeat protein
MFALRDLRVDALSVACTALILLAPLDAANASSAESGALTPAAYRKLALEVHRHMDAHRFEEAVAALERLVAYYSGDGGLWTALADARFALKRYRPANEAYEHSVALGFGRPPDTLYRIAQAYALAGDQAAALAALDRALAAGYERRPEIAGDPAFADLRAHPAFATLTGALPARSFSRDEGWRYDLAFLVSEITRLHYVYRSQPLHSDFKADASALDESIPKLSDAQITVRLQRLLARLGDGHSISYCLGGKRPLPRLPIRVYLFADGLFVVGAPDEYRRLVGRRVERIGDMDALDAVAHIAPYVSQDNPMFVKAIGMYLLLSPDFLQAAGVVADAREVTLTFDDGRGGREKVRLRPEPPGELVKTLRPSELPGAPPPPRYLRDVSDPYWFEPLPDHDAVYFAFNAVTDKQGESIADFALRLQRSLDERHGRNLIVDVRNNVGGNGELLVPILRTLVHFETSRPDARLFVVTSRSTFSAAQIFIARLERMTNAVFVGEPSSSSPTFVGEDTLVVLPYSGTAVSISSRFHTMDPSDRRQWIPPAIPVALTSNAYFANQDLVLDELLRAIDDPR